MKKQQILTQDALESLGEDKACHECYHDIVFERAAQLCEHRFLRAFKIDPNDKTPACGIKTDPFDWTCHHNGCPYVVKAHTKMIKILLGG